VLVEIWSDVVCPWCYIGKRRFDAAVTQVAADRDAAPDELFDVRYRPYQLDPTAPPGTTTPVAEVYARKFGGPDRAEEIFSHLRQVASSDGLDLRFDIAVRANTRLAHQALWLAEGTGRQAALEEELFAAYFTNGLDLHDDEVVGGVVEQLATAASNGITAVPTFVLDGRWAIPGAQDIDVFTRALARLLDRRSESD
jgi:predicted DsbA family dithiol-disulfide isomerase